MTKKKAEGNQEEPGDDRIGFAFALPDGTLRLMLWAEADGVRGEAMMVIPPDHKDYAMFVAHLGGIQPGENKPIPPFP